MNRGNNHQFRGRGRGHSSRGGNNAYNNTNNNDQYRDEVPPPADKDNGHKKQNKMSNRDKNKAEAYREKQNANTMDRIDAELNKILHPGFASLANVVKDLTITQRTARVIPVSTHAIGPILRENVMRTESEMQGRGMPLNFNKHAFYRVALAMFETKLYTQYKLRSLTPYSTTGFQDGWMPSELRDRCLGIKTHFLAFVNFLNAVGNLSVGDVKHYVGIPNVLTPFTISLGNLRLAVTLAREGPLAIRRNYYRNNPFPFGVWEGPPGDRHLANPDEIMPVAYQMDNFLHDVEVCKQFFEAVNRKYPKRVSSAVNYELEGHKSILVSCQGRLRCSDHVEGENAHATPYLEEDVGEFWSSEPAVSDQDFYYASLTMAGRFPSRPIDQEGFKIRDPVGAIKSGVMSARTNMSVHY